MTSNQRRKDSIQLRRKLKRSYLFRWKQLEK